MAINLMAPKSDKKTVALAERVMAKLGSKRSASSHKKCGS